jgi:ketosteroid isomerase-like protein
MKKWRMMACVALASLALTAGVGAQDVQSDQQILIELERQWDRAFRSRNVEVLDRVLAEDFIATYGDGQRGDKAKELALATEFDQQVDSSRLDEFIVRIYRDTAVVLFTQHLVGPVQGKPTDVTYRYIDVWVIRDGRWQCVTSQSTRVGQR